MKVYGPYKRKKDGREIVITVAPDGTRKTTSYPKFLMEQKLGRPLDPDAETIDHIDGDFLNNDFTNLRILPRVAHIKEDAVRSRKVIVQCITCARDLPPRRPCDINTRAKGGFAGPFCRSCAGKYGKRVQLGSKLLPAQPQVVNKKYRLKEQNMPSWRNQADASGLSPDVRKDV